MSALQPIALVDFLLNLTPQTLNPKIRLFIVDTEQSRLGLSTGPSLASSRMATTEAIVPYWCFRFRAWG